MNDYAEIEAYLKWIYFKSANIIFSMRVWNCLFNTFYNPLKIPYLCNMRGKSKSCVTVFSVSHPLALKKMPVRKLFLLMAKHVPFLLLLLFMISLL